MMRIFPMTFLLGLVLGISIGMLLAPATGSETRHKVPGPRGTNPRAGKGARAAPRRGVAVTPDMAPSSGRWALTSDAAFDPPILSLCGYAISTPGK